MIHGLKCFVRARPSKKIMEGHCKLPLGILYLKIVFVKAFSEMHIDLTFECQKNIDLLECFFGFINSQIPLES